MVDDDEYFGPFYTGTLPAPQPGRFAGLVAIKGDPLTDIRLLERITFVMKDGVVVRQGDSGR